MVVTWKHLQSIQKRVQSIRGLEILDPHTDVYRIRRNFSDKYIELPADYKFDPVIISYRDPDIAKDNLKAGLPLGFLELQILEMIANSQQDIDVKKIQYALSKSPEYPPSILVKHPVQFRIKTDSDEIVDLTVSLLPRLSHKFYVSLSELSRLALETGFEQTFGR